MTVQPVNQRTVGAHSMSMPAPRGTVPSSTQLLLRVTYGTCESAVVSAEGDVDLLSSRRLHELLQSRLRSALRTVVVDLSKVTFMSIEGARVLVYAANYAHCHDKELRIELGDSDAVARLLRATSLGDRIPVAIPTQGV